MYTEGSNLVKYPVPLSILEDKRFSHIAPVLHFISAHNFYNTKEFPTKLFNQRYYQPETPNPAFAKEVKLSTS